MFYEQAKKKEKEFNDFIEYLDKLSFISERIFLKPIEKFRLFKKNKFLCPDCSCELNYSNPKKFNTDVYYDYFRCTECTFEYSIKKRLIMPCPW